jgi:hypothetical protein
LEALSMKNDICGAAILHTWTASTSNFLLLLTRRRTFIIIEYTSMHTCIFDLLFLLKAKIIRLIVEVWSNRKWLIEIFIFSRSWMDGI